MRMDRDRRVTARSTAALHLGEPFQPIAQVLQRPYLRVGQGPGLQRRQRQPREPPSRVTGHEHAGGLSGDPGREPGQ